MEGLLAHHREAECAIRSRFHVSHDGGAGLTSEDIEDALQSAYCSIWKRILDHKYIPFTADSAARRFVVTVAVRSAIDLYRRKKARVAEWLVDEFNRYDRPVSINRDYLSVDDAVSVGLFLSEVCGLSDKAAGVLALLLAGNPADWVATQLELTQSHCLKLRWRAVRHLRTQLENDPQSEDRIRLALE